MLRKDYIKINAQMRVADDLPQAVTLVVETRAGPSIIVKNLLPPGWRERAWRAPTKNRFVDAFLQILKPLGSFQPFIFLELRMMFGCTATLLAPRLESHTDTTPSREPATRTVSEPQAALSLVAVHSTSVVWPARTAVRVAAVASQTVNAPEKVPATTRVPLSLGGVSTLAAHAIEPALPQSTA